MLRHFFALFGNSPLITVLTTDHLTGNDAMKLMKLVRNAALAAMLLTAGVANATLLQFTVTGDYNATWQIDSAVPPDDIYLDEGFIVWDVPGFDDAILGVADITFFNAGIGGGIQIEDYYLGNVLLSTDGPQVYTGTEENPIYTLGTFALTEYLGTGTYTLTIAEVGAAAVPEPATGALLLGGLALMGALRKRRNA